MLGRAARRLTEAQIGAGLIDDQCARYGQWKGHCGQVIWYGRVVNATDVPTVYLLIPTMYECKTLHDPRKVTSLPYMMHVDTIL